MKDIIVKCCNCFEDSTRFYEKFNYTENKDTSITVCCDSLMLFKVSELKKSYKIFSKIHIQADNITSLAYLGEKEDFFRYSIEDKDLFAKCLSEFIEAFMQDVDAYILENYPAEPFGCCSRYIECSDNKRCIHPDVLHSKGCIYRKNLENGRVFYGKNKNI